MTKFTILLMLIVSVGLSSGLECESYEDRGWFEETHRACLLRSTPLRVEGLQMAVHDSSVTGIDFYNNKNVWYLPTEVSTRFPNLKYFYAHHCAIETLSKDNFKRMKNVMKLYLHNNQIHTIHSTTFDDMKSLQDLRLNDNRIKTIIGLPSPSLTQLDRVDLTNNVCLSKNFVLPNIRGKMSNAMAGRCDFHEIKEDLSLEIDVRSY